jgi:hypothetical protein
LWFWPIEVKTVWFQHWRWYHMMEK